MKAYNYVFARYSNSLYVFIHRIPVPDVTPIKTFFIFGFIFDVYFLNLFWNVLIPQSVLCMNFLLVGCI